jgi:hypothetical protein
MNNEFEFIKKIQEDQMDKVVAEIQKANSKNQNS